MKGLLSFNLPEETEQFEDACKGSTYKWKLDEVWDEVFRPHMKHGYGTRHLTEEQSKRLNELTDKPQVSEALDLLMEIYRSVRRDGDL